MINARRGRFVVAMLLALAPFSVTLGKTPRRDKPYRLQRDVAMGDARIRLSDTCFLLGANLSSGEFFENIEVRQDQTGTKYFKGSVQVAEFPEKLDVEILGMAQKCGTTQLEEPEIARKELEQVRLEVWWKTGLRTRPASNFDVKLRQPTPQEWRDRPSSARLAKSGITPPPSRAIWLIELTVHGEHASLSDSLIVTLTLPSGVRIARFSARV